MRGDAPGEDDSEAVTLEKTLSDEADQFCADIKLKLEDLCDPILGSG